MSNQDNPQARPSAPGNSRPADEKSLPAHPRARAGLLAVVLSGGMYVLAFPPFDAFPLAWIALVPLLLFLTRSSWKSALLWTALFGFGVSVILVSWLRHVTYAGWFALAVYVSIYFIGFGMAFRCLYRRLKIPVTFLAPVVWVAFELLRGWVLGGFEWFYLGHSQYLNLPFIQAADVVGALGLSFALAMVSGAIVDAAALRGKAIAPVAATGGVLAIIFVYGLIRLAQYSPEEGPKVALIQGNVPIDLKHTPDTREVEQYVRDHARLSLTPEAREADLILWPETMVPVPLNLHVLDAETQPDRDVVEYILLIQRLWDIVSETARDTGRHMLVGAGAQEIARRQSFNSAYLISPEGEITGRYDKIHLVAFGEYTPLKSIFPALTRFRPPQMGEDLTHGRDFVIFSFPWNGRIARFAATICYEDTVPRVVRRFARRNPDFIVNISNDAWFKNSAELDQHLAISVFRAVETRRPLARASNTGISSLVEPNGRIQTVLMEDGKRREIEGALVGELKLSNLNGLYVHIGETFSIICLIATVCLLVGAFWKGGSKRQTAAVEVEAKGGKSAPRRRRKRR